MNGMRNAESTTETSDSGIDSLGTSSLSTALQGNPPKETLKTKSEDWSQWLIENKGAKKVIPMSL